MEKVIPDVYRKYTPYEYQREFERIEKEIKQMDDVDFEIIVNTAVPFYFDFMVRYTHHPHCKDCFNASFKEFTQKPINVQKSAYIHYLKNIFQFPQSMFLFN